MVSKRLSLAFKVCGPMFIAFLFQGCTTVPSEEQRTQAGVLSDIRGIQEDLNKINGRQDQLEATAEELRQNMRSLGAGETAEKAVVEKRLSALESRIKSVDEAREVDKKEIIEKLSKKIVDVINKHRGPVEREPPGGGTTGGRRVSSAGSAPGAVEHVVKEKESLSLIAQKYGVTVDAIVAANRLKNANVVRVGQVLKIPQ